MNTPQIGDMVEVRHTVRMGKRGIPYLNGAAMVSKAEITKLYHSGRVQVSSGDTWRITQHNGTWVTSAII